jgi:uncharacterized membrane protein YphA (DoxX/SURF4 family)
MRDEDVIDMQEADEMHEAMDYAQHEKTWETFLMLVKTAIIQLAFIVVGLFCIIQGGVPVFGGILILIGLLYPVGAAFLRTAR